MLGIDTNGDTTREGVVVIHIGPSPNFTGCAANWQSTGNVIGNEDAGRYDYSSLGGSPFTTYSNAPASVTGGRVVQAFIVVDGSWSAAATGGDGEQTVLVDNIKLNTDVATFADRDDCKDGGWENVFRADGSAFKNQGDCVQYVNTGN